MIYIMRGLPGSGKSTWLRNLWRSLNLTNVAAPIFSADDYHMSGGKYCYDPKNAGKAHGNCLRSFAVALVSDMDDGRVRTMAVDNTNTTIVELAPYARLCEAFNRDYQIVLLECSLEDAVSRNVHEVPVNTILAMRRNLLTEIVPSTWT